MSTRQQIALEIGNAIISAHEAKGVADAATARTESAYTLLRECIVGGQVPEEHVPGLLARDPDFAAWYASSGGAL